MWDALAVGLLVAAAALFCLRKFLGPSKGGCGCGHCPCKDKGRPGGEPPCRAEMAERSRRYGQTADLLGPMPPCYKSCLPKTPPETKEKP